MQKIPFELAKPGMVLDKGITGHEGNLLVSEGEVLNDAVLRRLGMAGVTHVVVQGKPVSGFDMGYDVAARRERVEFLFRNHKDNIFMKTVCNFLIKHFEQRL